MQAKPAQNAPCPCGSGKKFKMCCATRHVDTRRSVGGVNSEATLQAAITAFRNGDRTGADVLSRRIPAGAPQAKHALNLRAMVAHAEGQFVYALELCDQALRLDPTVPEFYNNRGNALQALQRYEEAQGCFEEAIRRRPAFAEAVNNLATIIMDQGRATEALTYYKTAIGLRPNYSEAYENLGKVYVALGHLEEATAAFLQAIHIDPRRPECYSALGGVYLELGFHDAAIEAYEEAIRLKPDFGSAFNNLGTALNALGRYADAVRAFEHARALEPQRAEIHNNLGGIFLLTGYHDEALASYAKAVECNPDYLNGVEGLYQCLRTQCAWERLEEVGTHYRGLIQNAVLGSRPAQTSPFNAFTIPLDPLQQRALVEHVSRDITTPLLALRNSLPAPAGYQDDRRLRIGYISNDYRSHATAHLLGHLFARHDRTRFEVIAYSTGPNDGSSYRRRIEDEAERFEDLQGLPPVQAATQIRMDNVDILVDLHGHTVGASLATLALRPAPVQIHFLGYPGTVGKELVDYSLVDDVVCPPEHERFYSEKVYRLPDTYHMNEHELPGKPLARKAYGLPEKGFVFCCFNAAYKLTPMIFHAWMRILKQTPGSVLWLYGGNQAVVRNLTVEAARHGISTERIVFGPHVAKDLHLARLCHADLMLDTPIINAMTTASDALWVGIPVLSILGKSFPDRAGASLLTAIGLPELIMPNLEAYESTAIHLAQHPEEIAALKARLAANRLTYPLFDTARFVRNLETAYEDIWKRHLSESNVPVVASAI